MNAIGKELRLIKALVAAGGLAALLGAPCAAVANTAEPTSNAQIWSNGFFWDLNNIQWIELNDTYNVRANAEIASRDRNNQEIRGLSIEEALDGLCASVLSFRPSPPREDIGRRDIFRISVNIADPSDPDTFLFERPYPMSVIDGQCAPARPDAIFPLGYTGQLHGWGFRGFMETEPDVLRDWDAEAFPVFIPVGESEGAVPLDLLCQAAAFEARYWRPLGSFREGTRLAIGVVTNRDQINFTLAMWFGGECSFPSEGQVDDT